jgi:hypothetical protein
LRTAVVAISALATVALSPAWAEAVPTPDVEPVVIQAEAGVYCDFALKISIYDEQKLHDNGGVVLWTGRYVATIENVETGAAMTFNAPGPTLKDGVVTGPYLIGQPSSRNLGSTFLIFHRGRVTFNADNTIATKVGKTVDICAALS